MRSLKLVTSPPRHQCLPRSSAFRHRFLSTMAEAQAEKAPATPEPPPEKITEHTSMTPRAIVDELDKHIVGQSAAKRAVAIALRNRWRRQLLGDELKAEIVPRNILMIGPTGVGKTEIARRLSKLAQAPFIKVEATKFTEVGFHGRDVDQIIRDLVEVSITLTRKKRVEAARPQAQAAVETRILDTLTGSNAARSTQSSFRDMLRKGVLDDRQIEIDLPTDRGGGASADGRGGGVPGYGGVFGFTTTDSPGGTTSSSPTFNEVIGRFAAQAAANASKRATERKRMTIKEARPLIEELEIEKLMDTHDIQKEAIQAVEESGIVFIDEIDKIVNSGDYKGADASAEGVQRDLLPLIEGSTIQTKYGNVTTDYILFIASGAFHSAKPSDLLAELQGRLPIRVELNALTEADLYRILTEPEASLISQQRALLATEHVSLQFTDDAVKEIARVASLANRTVENIGARRLHTCIERIMDDVSFDACDYPPGSLVTIDKDYVQKKVDDFLVQSDLSKYIL